MATNENMKPNPLNPLLTGEESIVTSERGQWPSYRVPLCDTDWVYDAIKNIEESKKENTMETILEEAQRLVNGQRREDYGDMRACFARIARMWSGYLDIDVSSRDVAHMMIMLKIARNFENYNRDGYTDIAGYAYCAELLNEQSSL